MSIVLDPKDTFIFPRPSEEGQRKPIRVTNPNAVEVGFKFKTTAPKHYCVRPNSGFIAPGQSLEVQVLFQKRDDLPPGTKCKDKFLVQAICLDAQTAERGTIPREDADFWQIAETHYKIFIREYKLRCEFLGDSDGGIKEDSKPAAAAAAAAASNPETLASVDSASAASTSPASAGASAAPADWMNEREVLLRELAALKNESVARKAENARMAKALQQNAESSAAAASASARSGEAMATKTVVNPNTYSPKVVAIVALIAFVLGLILY